jgi:hypothetical protein
VTLAVRAPRRLPGFRFETQPPPLRDVLPRMDVAVFVGFTASGPLQIPVAVEDVARFEALFGVDAPLAWDPEQGAMVYAYLAPAVRAFFRNGGSRCWIIRVAGPTAIANQFILPAVATCDEEGRVVLDDTAKPAPATLAARSEGSWSDDMRLACELEVESLNTGRAIPWMTPRVALAGEPEPATVPSFRLTLDEHNAVSNGDLLKLTFRNDSNLPESPRTIELLLAVRGVKQPTNQLTEETTKLIAPIDADGQSQSAIPFPLPGGLVRIERLTFRMRVRQQSARDWSLTDLGFLPEHPRYWGGLPSDVELLDPEFDSARRGSGLWNDVRTPRFPLAALNGSQPRMSIPRNMPIVAESFQVAPAPTSRALERDGLATFGAALFFDTRDPRVFQTLLESGVQALMAEADFLKYQESSPRKLQGLHAALDIEEATLICVPDAVHRSWGPPIAMAPPSSPLPSPPLKRPEWWSVRDCASTEPIPAVIALEPGQFLDCGLKEVPAPTLELHGSDRDSAGPIADGVSATFAVGALLELTWTSVAGATHFLEEASDREFSDARLISNGPRTQYVLRTDQPGDRYYRVRSQVGRLSSDYSNGIVVRIVRPVDFHYAPVEEYRDDDLLVVQRAVLRLCATRGDLFAVLALPEHYREDRAIAHTARLRSSADKSISVARVQPSSRVESSRPAITPDLLQDASLSFPLNPGEAIAHSFGAVYHPWLIGREESSPQELRRSPGDGAMAGIMARRALSRGAWVAPANEPLSQIVALTPEIDDRRRLDLLEVQVNLLSREPRGLVATGADTLCLDDDLRPLNVRRLLCLLRRLLVRNGAAYAFESNDDSLRRSIERNLEADLDLLLVRGAFAGRDRRTSYQVEVGPKRSSTESIDQGRLIVEVRVAPSRPLEFLTIRLVQNGDRGVLTEAR